MEPKYYLINLGNQTTFQNIGLDCGSATLYTYEECLQEFMKNATNLFGDKGPKNLGDIEVRDPKWTIYGEGKCIKIGRLMGNPTSLLMISYVIDPYIRSYYLLIKKGTRIDYYL